MSTLSEEKAAETAEPTTVWVVVFEHDHGTDVTVYAGENLAWQSVAEIVRYWYETEVPRPEDQKEIERLLAHGTNEDIAAASSLYCEIAEEGIGVYGQAVLRAA